MWYRSCGSSVVALFFVTHRVAGSNPEIVTVFFVITYLIYAQITLLKEQMEATRKEDHDEAVTKATARAKVKAESVKEDAENLEKVLTSPVALEDWDNADDLSIEQAMKNLKSWRDGNAGKIAVRASK